MSRQHSVQQSRSTKLRVPPLTAARCISSGPLAVKCGIAVSGAVARSLRRQANIGLVLVRRRCGKLWY